MVLRANLGLEREREREREPIEGMVVMQQPSSHSNEMGPIQSSLQRNELLPRDPTQTV